MRYRIREYRRRAELTQTELSKRAKVSRATISALENGRQAVTTTGTLMKLAAVLECQVQDFLCP